MLTSVRVCVFLVRMQCVVRVFCAEMKCTKNKAKRYKLGHNENGRASACISMYLKVCYRIRNLRVCVCFVGLEMDLQKKKKTKILC